jgi:Icc-related predicted phosphoesterase
MRIAALFDIHANLPALDAVLMDVRAAGVDLIVCGGDVIPGPMTRETLARVRDTAYPQAAEFAATCILSPPSELQMLELFTRISF